MTPLLQRARKVAPPKLADSVKTCGTLFFSLNVTLSLFAFGLLSVLNTYGVHSGKCTQSLWRESRCFTLCCACAIVTWEKCVPLKQLKVGIKQFEVQLWRRLDGHSARMSFWRPPQSLLPPPAAEETSRNFWKKFPKSTWEHLLFKILPARALHGPPKVDYQCARAGLELKSMGPAVSSLDVKCRNEHWKICLEFIFVSCTLI